MKRCTYCGHRCHGLTCQYCRHLDTVERQMRGESDRWRFGRRTFDVIAALTREDALATEGKAS